MISEKAKTEKNIVDSFGNVIKVYTETAHLLEDFAEIFDSKDINRVRGGVDSGIQRYISKTIGSPDSWLPAYVGWDFWPKGQEEVSPCIAVMAVFPFPSDDKRDAVPYLIVGVIGESLSTTSTPHQQMLSLHRHFIQHKDKFLGKFLGEDGKVVDLEEGGIFKVLQLLKVSNKSVVKELAKWVLDRWEKHGKIK